MRITHKSQANLSQSIEHRALETARFCFIFVQRKTSQKSNNAVISRDFYRFVIAGGEVSGSYAERLIDRWLCHAFYT
ncbi:MAG: hypothetical protein ACREDY_26685 [Bradyrhizobium sp.]